MTSGNFSDSRSHCATLSAITTSGVGIDTHTGMSATTAFAKSPHTSTNHVDAIYPHGFGDLNKPPVLSNPPPSDLTLFGQLQQQHQHQKSSLGKPQKETTPIQSSGPATSNEDTDGKNPHPDTSSQPAKKRYPCRDPMCNQTFSTSGHLSRHMKIHTGELAHSCPIAGCTSRFSRRDNMIQHYLSHQRKLVSQNLPFTLRSKTETPVVSKENTNGSTSNTLSGNKLNEPVSNAAATMRQHSWTNTSAADGVSSNNNYSSGSDSINGHAVPFFMGSNVMSAHMHNQVSSKSEIESIMGQLLQQQQQDHYYKNQYQHHQQYQSSESSGSSLYGHSSGHIQTHGHVLPPGSLDRSAHGHHSDFDWDNKNMHPSHQAFFYQQQQPLQSHYPVLEQQQPQPLVMQRDQQPALQPTQQARSNKRTLHQSSQPHYVVHHIPSTSPNRIHRPKPCRAGVARVDMERILNLSLGSIESISKAWPSSEAVFPGKSMSQMDKSNAWQHQQQHPSTYAGMASNRIQTVPNQVPDHLFSATSGGLSQSDLSASSSSGKNSTDSSVRQIFAQLPSMSLPIGLNHDNANVFIRSAMSGLDSQRIGCTLPYPSINQSQQHQQHTSGMVFNPSFPVGLHNMFGPNDIMTSGLSVGSSLGSDQITSVFSSGVVAATDPMPGHTTTGWFGNNDHAVERPSNVDGNIRSLQQPERMVPIAEKFSNSYRSLSALEFARALSPKHTTPTAISSGPHGAAPMPHMAPVPFRMQQGVDRQTLHKDSSTSVISPSSAGTSGVYDLCFPEGQYQQESSGSRGVLFVNAMSDGHSPNAVGVASATNSNEHSSADDVNTDTTAVASTTVAEFLASLPEFF